MKTIPSLATAAALALAAFPLHAQERSPDRPPDGPPQQRDGQRPGRAAQRPVAAFFGMLDANRDGAIDDGEMNRAADALRKRDQNGDGRITPDEFNPNPHGARGGKRDGERPRAARPDRDRRERAEAGQPRERRQERADARPEPRGESRDEGRGQDRRDERRPDAQGQQDRPHGPMAMGPKAGPPERHMQRSGPPPFMRDQAGAQGPQHRPPGPPPQHARRDDHRDSAQGPRTQDRSGPGHNRRPSLDGTRDRQGPPPRGDERRGPSRENDRRDEAGPRPPHERDARPEGGPQRRGFGDAGEEADAAPASAEAVQREVAPGVI